MRKSAAILSFVIGAMSIVAGGEVIRGWNPGWDVLSWLPVYNHVMGIFSAVVPTVLIWKNHRMAGALAVAILSIHTIVLLLLLTVFRPSVAPQSIFAMTSRFAIWLVILTLMYFSFKKQKE